MDKGKVFKYIIRVGFVIGGMSYVYYNFLKGKFPFYFPAKKENKCSDDFINLYLEKIKSKISLLYDKKGWTSDQKILCHINYLVNEIIYDIKQNNNKNAQINFNNDDDIKLFVYNNIINKYLGQDLTDMIPFINDNLILLPVNKDFIPLQRHDENFINKILKDNDEQKIEDSFFFASVKQIELDKLLNNIFDYENVGEIGNKNEVINSAKFNEIIKFKKAFKKEFFERYNFDSRFLIDVYFYLHNKKEEAYSNKEDIQLLINKVIY
jgi:hypothetical protein